MPSSANEADRPSIVASLVVDSATSGDAGTTGLPSARESRPRPVIHLGRFSDGDALYALGIPGASSVTWQKVGQVDLSVHSMERALAAGLSALAMKHVRDAGVQIGDAALVIGADPWSLMLLQWARLQGASPLAFVQGGPQSLREYASSFGADAVISDPTPGNLARAVKSTHRAAGFAIALDAIASEQSLTQALSTLRDGGRYVLAAITPQEYVPLNAYPDLHRRDLEMVSPMQSALDVDLAGMWRFSLNLAEQGRLRLDGLLDPTGTWRVMTSS